MDLNHRTQHDEIIIGSERENPTILYAHDAHRKNSDRVWVINVDRDGKYEFKASRWPEEANKRIAENREGDITSVINQAHLSIGNIQSAVDVTLNMKFTRFIIHLKAGRENIPSRHVEIRDEKDDDKLVAEFVSVRRLGPADPIAVSRYRSSNPDRLLKE